MKLFTTLTLLFFTALALQSAETTTVKVATGKSYANLAWYNLADDATVQNPLKSWDFSILVPGQNGSILINSGAGCKLWEVVGKTVDDFGTDLDTNGLNSNTTLFKEWFNSDDTWSIGAFNCGMNGFENDGDFGWGAYDMNTHFITGKKLFIFKDMNGNFFQIRIEDLISGEFTFSFANLDGSSPTTSTISKKSFPAKTFGYFTLSTNSESNIDADTWSLLFGKYIAQVSDDKGGFVPYMVNGIRHNYGWTAVKVSGQDPATVNTPAADQFVSKITTIGHEWKKLNTNYEWEIPTDLCYFVQSEDGLIWKLVFKAFAGSSTGEVTFEKTSVEPNVIKDNDGNYIGKFSISPNEIDQNGSFDIVYGIKESNLNSELSIFDLMGNKVYSTGLENNSFNALRVSPRLSSGMYFVVLKIAGTQSTQKLIVK